ncbi:MAG: DUF3300 domain-containing protein, partial [Alphaproteobacteria bacterium]|nr:DUF3300 domain-containing protein [Alphaproteobacteria bacterium]
MERLVARVGCTRWRRHFEFAAGCSLLCCCPFAIELFDQSLHIPNAELRVDAEAVQQCVFLRGRQRRAELPRRRDRSPAGEAIQRLRAEAMANGNLVSTAQQEVIVDGAVIRIVPAQAEVIYVPSYDPMLVYAGPPPQYGFITFGIGFTIGAWLNRDCDWHRHRIYYHGWRGRGWIDR